MQQHDFYRHYIDPLNQLGLEFVVTGSIAAIFYGEPRLTHDIDIILLLQRNDVERFCEKFHIDNYYCPPPEVIEIEIARATHAHFNLIHHQTGLKADCYIHTGDRLHTWALENRRVISMEEGMTIPLAPPEYVIIRKLQYFEEGGSDKHIRDVRSMLQHSNDMIDKDFLIQELKTRHFDHLLSSLALAY